MSEKKKKRTGLKIFLVIFVLLILVIAALGVDGYLTYQGITEKQDEFSAGTPTYSLADDNKTITISIVVDSPKLGYIPKQLKMTFEVYKETDLIDSSEDTLTLGESSTLTFVIVLTDSDASTIGGGGSITVTVKIIASPVIFGLDLGNMINALIFELGEETITIEA